MQKKKKKRKEKEKPNHMILGKTIT